MKNTESLGPCPICGRAMIEGPSVDRHHWVPRKEGGIEATFLHVVCHRMIHRLFDEKALAADFTDPAALREHPDIQRFVAWVRRQPADYVDWPKSPRGRRRGSVRASGRRSSGRRPAR